MISMRSCPFSEIHSFGTNPYFASNYMVDLLQLKSIPLFLRKKKTTKRKTKQNKTVVLLFILLFRQFPKVEIL